jgi:nitroimidazol reductase NimA-like FMN-containing flavoprotein (pyridoxamine 5'-phosphate oxidase superfamily)
MAELLGGDPQTRVRRLPEFARYEREVIYEILDATTLCHVGVVRDGAPLVLPTLFVRRGDTLLLHGSISSLLLRTAAQIEEISVAITLLDGLIVARSAFNSSMAYRSVVLFGPARIVEGQAEAEAALEDLVEGILPGRSLEVRRSSEAELRRTSVVEVAIRSASAKVSAGPPQDDPDDIEGTTWAGTVPLVSSYGAPIRAADGAVGRGSVEVPASVERLLGER